MSKMNRIRRDLYHQSLFLLGNLREGHTHKLNHASYLAKTWQAVSTCRRVQDGHFCKIEEEVLASTGKTLVWQDLARLTYKHLQDGLDKI